MLYGRLLDSDSHGCESPTDLSYPVVLLQGRKSGCDRFVECFRGDLYGVLNVSNILDRHCARSQNHKQETSIFAFCSLFNTIVGSGRKVRWRKVFNACLALGIVVSRICFLNRPADWLDALLA